MTTRAGNRGFTLIEMLIVVVIVGLLVTVGYPSYRDQVVRTHRNAAQQELMDLASVQERIFLNSNAYTASVTAAYTGQAAGGLGRASGRTDDGRYTLALAVPAGGQSYTLTATPVAGSTQDGDGNLTIASNGQRTWGAGTW